MKRTFFIVMMLIAVSGTVHAQRTADRQFFVEGGSGYPFSARVGMGQYLLNSYWSAGVDAVYQNIPLSSGDMLYFSPIVARGSFMYRFVGTRSRSLSLYGGGGVMLGAEILDPFHTLPDTVELGVKNKSSFILGPSVDLALEIFPFRQVGFVLGGRIPFLFLSQSAKMAGQTICWGAEGILTIRVNL